ncbi:MAG: CARDB domain-containing protein [Candidatus Aminicenantales bacterium]
MKKRLLILGLIAGCALAVTLPVRGTGGGQDSGTAKRVVDVEMTDVFADQCRIWVRITNKGNVKIDKVLREQVWVDGLLMDDSKSHYVLEPGAVFAHGVGADPGLKITGLNKKVRAFVDAENVLAELNETNNNKEVTLSCRFLGKVAETPVLARPDLIVSFEYKNVIRKDPNADGKFIWWADLEFTVTNQGPGGAAPCMILLEKDSGPGGAFVQAGPEISIPAVNAGQTIKKTASSYQHTGPAPTYRATVDAHNAVTETKEDNNRFTKKFPY